MPQPKIATCLYCGTRAALVLKGRERHELSCSSCGAPLHDMKRLRADHVEDATRIRPSVLHEWRDGPARPARPKPRKKKPRKSFRRRLFEEAFDLLEDIFD